MLVTNSLKNDLNHPNQYVVGLALCSLGNIGSMDRARLFDASSAFRPALCAACSAVRGTDGVCYLRGGASRAVLSGLWVKRANVRRLSVHARSWRVTSRPRWRSCWARPTRTFARRPLCAPSAFSERFSAAKACSDALPQQGRSHERGGAGWGMG
jgi:hypothetical protein